LLLRVASLAWLSRCSRREAIAERVALRTPSLPGAPWDVLPDNIGQLIRDDFPNLWRTRQENFGRGGRGAAPILRSQFVANESAAARARGKAAREREKTKEAEERAKKMSKRLEESQWKLFNSQEETDAALVWKEYASELEEALRVRVRPCETFEGVLEDVHRKLGRKRARRS